LAWGVWSLRKIRHHSVTRLLKGIWRAPRAEVGPANVGSCGQAEALSDLHLDLHVIVGLSGRAVWSRWWAVVGWLGRKEIYPGVRVEEEASALAVSEVGSRVQAADTSGFRVQELEVRGIRQVRHRGA